MNMQKKETTTAVLVLGATLLCLSGCNWFSSGEKKSSQAISSEVLLSINGKPALTVQEYEDQLDMARQANPQLDMLLQMMPNAEKDFIFKGMATGKLIKAWGEKQGLDKSSDFKKAQKQAYDAMDLNLYMKAFEEAHPITITDAELKAFYEEKKDSLPGLMIAPGGIQIEYIRFDSNAKAAAFLDKAREVKTLKAFKDLASTDKLTTADALVNDKSNFGDAVKQAILDIKKFPSLKLVKVSDNAFWVVFASSMTEAKYHELSNPGVEQGLRKYMTDERKEKQLESLIADLKKELSVEENHTYFQDKEKQKQEAMAGASGMNSDLNDGQEGTESNMDDVSSSTVKV